MVTRNLEEIAAIIGDEEFWNEVCNILAPTKPIYWMGEIYERLDCMLGEISNMVKINQHANDHQKMQETLVQR